MKRLLLLFCLIASVTTLFAQSKRYTETIFPSSTVTSNVVYDNAPFLNFPYYNESQTTAGDLVMDIYEPTGDLHTLRPVIIFAHSGGFATGDRTHDDMVAFCDSFARKGYVTATIDYRKGFYILLNAGMHSTRAAYRGLQDGRSAVRYLRANAATYGIDPNRVYLAGSSAGGFIALHSIYMTAASEKPTDANAVSYNNLVFPFSYSGPDLGGYDRGSNLDQSGTPNGVISLWGALFDLNLISSNDRRPVYMAHGSSDGIVPYNSGAPFGVSSFPTVYGSNLVNNRLAANGFTNKETYFVSGGDHEFYGTSNGSWVNGRGGNAHWDAMVPGIANFIWSQHKPTASFNFTVNGLSVDFNDQTATSTGWYWDFGDGNTSTQQNPTHVYASAGNYEVKLFVQNNLLSWDETDRSVDVLAPLPLSWIRPLQASYKDQQNQLVWTVAEQINNDHFVVEHSMDGKHFDAIAELDGAGNRAAALSYRYIHEKPSAGLHYYRIKQVDFNGEFSYSSVAAVEVNDQKATFSFSPNPARDLIQLVSHQPTPVWIDIYNGRGDLVKSEKVMGTRSIKTGDLAKGLYVIKMRATEAMQTLMIQ